MKPIYEIIPDFLDWELHDEITICFEKSKNDSITCSFLKSFWNLLDIFGFVNFNNYEGNYRGVIDEKTIILRKRDFTLQKIEIKDNFVFKHLIKNEDLYYRNERKMIMEHNEKIIREVKESEYNLYISDLKKAIETLRMQRNNGE